MIRFISFLLVFIFSWGLLVQLFPFTLIKILPDIFAILLFFIILINKKYLNKIKNLKIIIILLFFSFFSFLLSNSNLNIYFAGIRNYFKFIPIFLVPIIIDKKNQKILAKRIISIFVFFAFLQVPVAIFQRFFLYGGVSTGDVITGTLGNNASGLLTFFQFFAILLYLSLYQKGLISLRRMVIYNILLLIPCLINETKVTYILILSLFLIYFIRLKKNNILSFVFLSLMTAFFLYIFVNIYQTIQNSNVTEYLSTYIQNSLLIGSYNLQYAKGGSLDRVSQIYFALMNSLTDIKRLIFGVSIGNASDSVITSSVGYFYNKFYYLQIDKTYLSRILWEWGIIGTLIWIYFFIKAGFMAIKQNTLISFWFVGILIIFFISLPYNSSIISNQLGFLFWLILGFIWAYDNKQKKIAT